LRRGDVVVAVTSGAYGKPRPYVIVQSDLFRPPSLTLVPLTSTLEDIAGVRPRLEPSASNGLRQTSLAMCDKVQTVPIAKVDQVIGRLDDDAMRRIGAALALFLGIA
jgi:mRNA interferase MazF